MALWAKLAGLWGLDADLTEKDWRSFFVSQKKKGVFPQEMTFEQWTRQQEALREEIEEARRRIQDPPKRHELVPTLISPFESRTKEREEPLSVRRERAIRPGRDVVEPRLVAQRPSESATRQPAIRVLPVAKKRRGRRQEDRFPTKMKAWVRCASVRSVYEVYHTQSEFPCWNVTEVRVDLDATSQAGKCGKRPVSWDALTKAEKNSEVKNMLERARRYDVLRGFAGASRLGSKARCYEPNPDSFQTMYGRPLVEAKSSSVFEDDDFYSFEDAEDAEDAEYDPDDVTGR